MKSVMFQSLCAALVVLLLAGACQLVLGDMLSGIPQRLIGAAVAALSVGSLFALLLRRVRSEDHVARLEAALCLEQNARSQADQALAEADLLLARLTAPRGKRGGTPETDLIGQLIQIQAELAQLQQNTALDEASTTRLGRARDRLEQVARIVRGAARASEPG